MLAQILDLRFFFSTLKQKSAELVEPRLSVKQLGQQMKPMQLPLANLEKQLRQKGTLVKLGLDLAERASNGGIKQQSAND